MTVMQRLRMFVAEEPVVAASCLIGGFGLFLPAVVRPILDSFETYKQIPQTPLSNNTCIPAATPLNYQLPAPKSSPVEWGPP